jgi:small subunit ribosomal protein S3
LGQKVHPIGLRIGIIKDWESRWYADKKTYPDLLEEDLKIRKFIREYAPGAGISRIEIERLANRVLLKVHTARPGVIIGRGRRGIDEMIAALEKLTKKEVSVSLEEIRHPELDAQLVAESICQQIEKRISYKRAMRQAVARAMKLGAKGIKVQCKGRLAGAEMARSEKVMEGRVPLTTLRADIDYGFAEAKTTYGNIGVKVWIYKGDVLPEGKHELPARPVFEPRPQRQESGRNRNRSRNRSSGE